MDARFFPWGNRFDPSLSVTAKRGRRFLYDCRGGFEPRDESPFGVLDMAGLRTEWTRDRVRSGRRVDNAAIVYHARGGHWAAREQRARVASRYVLGPLEAHALRGFRLVARPR